MQTGLAAKPLVLIMIKEMCSWLQRCLDEWDADPINGKVGLTVHKYFINDY